MNAQLIVALSILGVIVVATPIVYIIYLFRQARKNRKEAQGTLVASFFDRVTNDEELVVCNVIDKYKIVVPGGNPKKEASKLFPHGYYLHFGAVKAHPMADDQGNEVGSYTGTITTKIWWPIKAKPETQVQMTHAYYNKGDPRPLNPFNAFLPVNTDVAVQVLADENALQTLLQHVRYEFESIFKMFDDMKATAKWQKYLVFMTGAADLIAIITLVVSIIIMKKV